MFYREGDSFNGYKIICPPWVDASEIDHAMNHGYMATSYMAKNPSGETVFLKLYKCPAEFDSWQKGYESYQRELKRIVDSSDELKTLTYRFLDFFLSHEAVPGCATYVQVFEFVKNGTDLRKFLNEDTGYDAEKRTTFAQLMMYAMAQFHAAGIVHCDLKPENMMLFPSDCKAGWNLRVVDFDWALLDGKNAPWTDVPDGMGYPSTDGYSSPEHCDGKRPTAASDVFTCGLMLYELLTKDGNPYSGFADDKEVYTEKVKSWSALDPLLIASHGDAADAVLRKTIRACLDPVSANRPTAAFVHKVLLAWSKGEVYPEESSKSPDHTGDEDKSSGKVKLTSVATGCSLDPFVLKSDVGSRLVTLFVPPDEAKFFGSRLFTLLPEGGAWSVVPDGSAVNATYLNGNPIDAKTALKEGDVLAVGSRKNTSVIKGEMKVSFV